jgi:hypothetical protein
LHQGTDAAPTAFSASTQDLSILFDPSSYPLCDIAGHRSSTGHRPDSTTVPNSRPVPLSTQPGDSPDASPCPPSGPSHGGSIIAQQAEQANIIVGLPSSSDSTAPGGIGDSSLTPAATSGTSPVHTNSRPTDASPSVAAVAVLQGISLAATSSHPFEGTTQLAPLAPIISQHPEPVPATIKPSTGPGSSDPNTLQRITSSAYPSHPLEGDKQQDTVDPWATPEIGEIPPRVKPILRSAHTVTPTIIPSTSSDLLPALSATAELPSSVESAPISSHTRSGPHRSHPLQRPAPVSPQVASAPDAQVTSSMGTPSSHDDTHDPNPHSPMTVLPHSDQTARLVDDIVAAKLRPEDQGTA